MVIHKSSPIQTMTACLSGQIDRTRDADLGVFDLNMRFDQSVILAEMKRYLTGVLTETVMDHETDLTGLQQLGIGPVQIVRCENVDAPLHCGKGIQNCPVAATD
jgi:hypothetical protein